MGHPRRLQSSRAAALVAVTALLLGGCTTPADENQTLGGNRVFKYREQFYAVRCEYLRDDDLLGQPLAEVHFEDGSLDLRAVEGVDPGTAVAAAWAECASDSHPAPWILAVAGPESGAVDYEPYREILVD